MIRTFFRKTKVILFLTFLGYSLFFLLLISKVYNVNLDYMFESYQKEQLDVNIYKLMDDMRSEALYEGPFSDDEKQWLMRRATLYGILIEYEHPHEEVTWFQSASMVEQGAAVGIKKYPFLADGELKGYLTVSYIENINKLNPAYVFYYDTMKTRSAIIFIVVSLVSIFISFGISKILSRHVRQLNTAAAKIRVGDRNSVIPVQGPEEIRQLALTLRELAQDLEKQETWRNHLMEDLTHELRTPFTSILSQIEAIIDGVYEADEETLLGIYEDMIRLARLLNDMERLSEAEGAKFTLNLKRSNMVYLARRAYQTFLPIARQKDTKLYFQSVNVPCYSMVDRDKMIQVLSNLLSNAIKYTPEGGEITLGVTWSGEQIILYCEDNGMGISDKDLPYIFNRLYRADKSRSRFSGGVGLGLSIAKALVESHDGTIEVQSQLGKGSKFIVTLPGIYEASKRKIE